MNIDAQSAISQVEHVTTVVLQHSLIRAICFIQFDGPSPFGYINKAMTCTISSRFSATKR